MPAGFRRLCSCAGGRQEQARRVPGLRRQLQAPPGSQAHLPRRLRNDQAESPGAQPLLHRPEPVFPAPGQGADQPRRLDKLRHPVGDKLRRAIGNP